MFGMDAAEVGVFKNTDEIIFCSFLEGEYSIGLETEIYLEVLGDFTDETLKRQLADK